MSERKEGEIKSEIAGIFDVMTERLPKLMAAVKDSLFSERAGREIGRAVGAFYQELLAANISESEAAALTRSYLATLESAVRRETSTGSIKIEKGAECRKTETGSE